MSGRLDTRNWQKLIDCGRLIDVSYEGYDAGMLHPTAITAKAWDRYIKSESGPGKQYIELHRLQIILSMLRFHLAIDGANGSPFSFYVPKDVVAVHLDVARGARDNGTPAITLQLPREN